MSIKLPKPIAAYFAAENAADAGALARCFASDGIVHGEGGSFAGRAALEILMRGDGPLLVPY